jgi:hypothetical protein
MDTHTALDVTTLATAALITRTDGAIFRVTTSSEDITIDVGDGLGDQLYWEISCIPHPKVWRVPTSRTTQS